MLRKKNTKGMILEQKGTRLDEDGEDRNGLEMAILKSLAIFFNIHGDVAALKKALNLQPLQFVCLFLVRVMTSLTCFALDWSVAHYSFIS